jgi:GAF domain-containing protein
MNPNKPEGAEMHARGTKLPHHLGELLHKLLFLTHRGLTRKEFLRHAAEILIDYSGCDVVEIRVDESGRCQCCIAWITEDGRICAECRGLEPQEQLASASDLMASPIPQEISEAVLNGHFYAAAPFLTRAGSFWTADAARPILLREKGGNHADSRTIVIGGDYQSLALIPFPVDDRTKAILQLCSRRIDFFAKNDIQFHEAVAETLGVALAHQAAQWALGERVKELTCLYRIGKATQDIGRPADELLKDVVELLPPGWQYPEIASARIAFDGRVFAAAGFRDYPWIQSADIVLGGILRGRVEVAYSEEKPLADEGPFLKEERNLINGIAETLGISLAYQGVQWALRERVKELTCLQAIAAVAERPGVFHALLLRDIAALLPPAFQYPEITQARITIDGRPFMTPRFDDHVAVLASDIFVAGHLRGQVEVTYTAVCPPADEGPFLKEERSLINEVARQIGLILERRVVMTDGDIMDVPDLPSLMRPAAPREAGRQRTLAEIEAEYIKNVLASVDGNKSRAAEILGIDRKTLRKRLRQSPTGSD